MPVFFPRVTPDVTQFPKPLETVKSRVFSGRVPFLSPNQQCQSIEGTDVNLTKILENAEARSIRLGWGDEEWGTSG